MDVVGVPVPADAPPDAALRRLLMEYAPLRPDPLCPELQVHHAHSLVAVWEAAERLAGDTLPAPFWAYPWAGGSALARLILDMPDFVRGRTVLDFGAGGGIAAIAAAYAGAGRVVANDIDVWALRVTQIAAEAQSLAIDVLDADLCSAPAGAEGFDVLLCSDLAYERSQAQRQRSVLERAARRGATVLVANAERRYFAAEGMEPLAEFDVDVPHDLEGVPRRTARVYRLVG
jgi:predicted nicotinamide N-methyase